MSSTSHPICTRKSQDKDRGYAWVVLFWSALSHGVNLGFTFAVIGNLTIAHKEFFNIDLQLSSLIGTTHSGTIFLFGGIASVLQKKLGCRAAQIMGGCCIVLGYGLSALSTQTWHAFILFGVLIGAGVSTVYVASSQVLANYFIRRKHLAFSLVIIGELIGKAVWPIISQRLLSSVGYSKAMGVFSAFHAIHVIAGVFYIDQLPPTGNHAGPMSNATNPEVQSQESCNQLEMEVIGRTNQVNDQNQNSGIEEGDITEIPREIEPSRIPVGASNLRKDFKDLFKSPMIWLFLVNTVLWSSNLNTYYVFINDFIFHQLDSSKESTALGVTIFGGCSIAGAILVCAMSSLHFDRTVLHFTCSLLFGITTVVFAFSGSIEMYYILSSIQGFVVGAFIANLLGLTSSLCDADKLSLLLGVALMSQGISTFGATTLTGYIATVAGGQYGIILSGCFGIVSSLLAIPLMVHNMRQRKE